MCAVVCVTVCVERSEKKGVERDGVVSDWEIRWGGD